MKRFLSLFTVLMLILSACAPKFEKEDEIVQQTDDEQQKAIIPKYSISESHYRTILPFKPGEARGLVVENLNTRLDVDEFESGLMRIAQERFSPETYLFQEGQHLDRDTISSWLKRKKTKEQLQGKETSKNLGLNPAISDEGTNKERNEKSPIYLAHIMEHNYLERQDNKVRLGGVVLGLALNSVHYYETEQGYPREVELSQKDIEREGKKIAQEVLSRVRNIKELREVPITIALFKQQPATSIIPGHFFAVTHVDKGSSSIEDWEKINQEYYFLPSDEAEKNHREDNVKFKNFKSDIDEFFPNYTGVVGTAFYQNDELKKLTINITMQFYGKAEVIGFTQFVTGLVMEHFPKYVTVQVYISSVSGPESLIVLNAGEESPFVHIYE